MFFTITLVIDDCNYDYLVSTIDEQNMLLFKPISTEEDCNPVIFYAKKTDNNWQVLNVKDEHLQRQVIYQIAKHSL